MDTPITRAEHEEFRRRLEAEDERLNKRVSILEETVRQTNELTLSVAKLANTMEGMLAEQKEQGQRLEKLESTPTRNWNTVKAAILTAIGTAIGAGILAAFLYFVK